MLSSDKRPKDGLQIRDIPSTGPQVIGVIKTAVSSYEEIDRQVEIATKNRSIGKTEMNSSSSRAHTVITIEFR